MSYFEDVYLPRINRNGSTIQERILSTKAKQFEDAYLKKSVYRVEFTYGAKSYVGSLQPVKEDEKISVANLLTATDVLFTTGITLEIDDKKWLVILNKARADRGYNKHVMFLLDRTLTWWNNNIQYTCPVSFNGQMTKEIEDMFSRGSGSPSVRQASNLFHVIMPTSASLAQDLYCKIDGSSRRFVVSGFDLETVPGVTYATLDITMARTDAGEVTTPSSFWGV